MAAREAGRPWRGGPLGPWPAQCPGARRRGRSRHLDRGRMVDVVQAAAARRLSGLSRPQGAPFGYCWRGAWAAYLARGEC